jgi:hypothetical protein
MNQALAAIIIAGIAAAGTVAAVVVAVVQGRGNRAAIASEREHRERELALLRSQADTVQGQLTQARIANELPTVIGLFRDYRWPDMREARARLFDELQKGTVLEGVPITQLPEPIRGDALMVSHFLDNLGVLVAEGFMKPELAAGFLGTTSLSMWRLLKPHIDAERDLRAREGWEGGSDYQRYFEHLAETLRETDPTRVRRSLKHWRGD